MEQDAKDEKEAGRGRGRYETKLRIVKQLGMRRDQREGEQ